MLRLGQSLLGRQTQPQHRLAVIACRALAGTVHVAQIVLRGRESLLGGLEVPLVCLAVVFGHPFAEVVHHADVVGGAEVASLGKRPELGHGRCVVTRLVGGQAFLPVGEARSGHQPQRERRCRAANGQTLLLILFNTHYSSTRPRQTHTGSRPGAGSACRFVNPVASSAAIRRSGPTGPILRLIPRLRPASSSMKSLLSVDVFQR